MADESTVNAKESPPPVRVARDPFPASPQVDKASEKLVRQATREVSAIKKSARNEDSS